MTETTEPRWCEAQIFAATRIDPAEYCDEEAREGSDYCDLHAGYDDEPDYGDPYADYYDA